MNLTSVNLTSVKLTDVLTHLNTTFNADIPCQLLDPPHPWHGAYVSPVSRLAEPSHGTSSRFIFMGSLLLWAAREHPAACPELDCDDVLSRITLTADYMLRAQHPSGLIDLRSTNYDSSPDTGFVMQLFCALLDLTQGEAYFEALNGKLEQFLRCATPGVRDGGFHTPNHRWVIASALAQVHALFPDLDVQPALDLYLDEGFDIDADGAYIERSVGIYDTVSNNALMLYILNGTREDVKQHARVAVRKNLEFNLHLLHADGTAETGLSNRQDYGIRKVASNLICPYVFAYHLLEETRFLQAAAWLWSKTAITETPESLHWLAYVLLKLGEPKATTPNVPDDFQCFFPANQVWRARRDKLSVSAYGARTQLLNLCYGQAEIRGLTIAQTYFGTGRFVSDEITATDSGIVMTSTGKQKPRRPGYELPLGQPVTVDTWDDAAEQRDYRPLPLPLSQLSIGLEDTTLELHYQTLDGFDGVAAQLALDVPVGGVWETSSSLLELQAGNVIIYKQGPARLIYGQDVLEFSNGHAEHGFFNMRHSEAVSAGCARIIFSFLTLVDFHLNVHCYTGLTQSTAFKTLAEVTHG